jgi:hypothetical protein
MTVAQVTGFFLLMVALTGIVGNLKPDLGHLAVLQGNHKEIPRVSLRGPATGRESIQKVVSSDTLEIRESGVSPNSRCETVQVVYQKVFPI